MNYINCHSHTDTQTKRTDTKKKTKNKKKRHYKTKELIIKRVKYTHERAQLWNFSNEIILTGGDKRVWRVTKVATRIWISWNALHCMDWNG